MKLAVIGTTIRGGGGPVPPFGRLHRGDDAAADGAGLSDALALPCLPESIHTLCWG